MRRPLAVLALLSTLSLAAAGCASSAPTPAASEDPVSGSIEVYAAASLQRSFDEIATAFEAAHPGVTVQAVYDGSSTLATQIGEGAPADVFASADEKNMAKLTDADLVKGEPAVFAKNQLVIVTKPGNPEGIESLADLADAGVISLCGEDVPCGTFAAQALEEADVTIPESSVTRGQNAKATLTAVSEGDAVAGIVYVTDALAAGDAVDAVEIPAEDDVVATYPIAVLTDTRDAALASAFVDYVSSDDGQAILRDRGFLPPS